MKQIAFVACLGIFDLLAGCGPQPSSSSTAEQPAAPASRPQAAAAKSAASAAFAEMLSDPRITLWERQEILAIKDFKALLAKHHDDLDAVYRKLHQRYESGDAVAALQLGFLYRDPDFTWHSDKEALAWTERSANAGLEAGIGVVAQLYRSRALAGDKGAFASWLHWAQLGAGKGMHDLQMSVARTYATGHVDGLDNTDLPAPGMKPDTEKAAYWFEQAAQHADPQELDEIGDRFQNGDGVPQRIGEAIRLYERESDVGGDDGEGYNDAAWVLATCPLAPQDQKDEAVSLAEKALTIAKADIKPDGGWIAGIEDTLAAAYASEGEFERAAATERRAMEDAKQSGYSGLVKGTIKRFQKRLDSYLQLQPWVMPDKCRDNETTSKPGA